MFYLYKEKKIDKVQSITLIRAIMGRGIGIKDSKEIFDKLMEVK
jgi:ribosomal protein L7/L12